MVAVRITWLVMAVALLWPVTVFAQSEAFERKVQQAITQARDELRAESERIEREQAIRRQQLDDLGAACRDLSDELVEAKLALAHRQQELAQLREQRETLWTEQVQWQRRQRDIAQVCRDVHEQLGEWSKTLPSSEHRSDQEEQLTQLHDEFEQGDVPAMVTSTLALLHSFLDEARTTAVYDTAIIDPRGRSQQATMVRVGRNVFAYHIPSTNKTAVAIAAPYEDEGYRWQEDLPGDMQKAIIAAIEQMQTSSDPVWLPVDVTGRISAATDLSARTLSDRLRSGGIVMIPLAVVALCLAVLVAERFFVLLRQGRHSLSFCDRVLELCNSGRFDEAERLADRSRGVLSRTLKVCLTHRHSPPGLLDDAIQETLLHEFPKLERFLPSIRMLSSVAPMLGLLGTVTGIIATFDIITVVGSGQPRLMAGGIAQALITTATGLAIAIPGLLAHSVLSGKVDGLMADTERFAATLSNLVKQHQYANGADRRQT